MKLQHFLNTYTDFKNKSFCSRYFTYIEVEQELKNLSPIFGLKEEGSTVEGRRIYSLNFGTGKKRILGWSQMHGNETTTTKALFDFFEFIQSEESLAKQFLNNFSFKIFPVLNPDGAQAYTRKNANQVDLNRDSVDLSQPESRLLRKAFNEFSPDLCLNLHGQRSIFGIKENKKTSAISFLSPSVDAKRQITEVRKQSMRLISAMNKDLQEYLPGQIGRYNDGYNLNCIGDYMQTCGVPTILFEAGQIKDYQREDTRKWICLAYLSVLNAFAENKHKLGEWVSYLDIPVHEKNYFDIILRKAKINELIIDIAIQFEEKLDNNKIEFIPRISKIGGLDDFNGHKEFDLEAKNIMINGGLLHKTPQINEIWTTISVENKNIVLGQG